MLEKVAALLLAILLTPVIASCVSARKNPEDIQDGVQTKQQIRRWFGGWKRSEAALPEPRQGA